MSPILAAALARAEAADVCVESAADAAAPLPPANRVSGSPDRNSRLSVFRGHPTQQKGGRRS
ncbi:hypothetical protein ACFZA2_07935 [Microbacterium sp. NPDC007973]|uniref:hypothetical protein n=1 Tax=Microbacterium sp. NPDC007973 TaxID=3364182 RepID=UPI0036F15243